MLHATKRSSRSTLGRNMRFFKLKIVVLLIAMLAIAGCNNKHSLDGPAVYNDVNIRLSLVDELCRQWGRDQKAALGLSLIVGE